MLPDMASTNSNNAEARRRRGPKPLRLVRVGGDHIEGPEMLTQPEVAQLLNVRRETLWAWERRGLLIGVSVGPLKRYPRERVEALLR
jgi:hypothetical protein